ncbi:MAG: hypothetical protein R3C17_06720 [Planctomycetaceae bacterium]
MTVVISAATPDDVAHDSANQPCQIRMGETGRMAPVRLIES